MDIKIGEIRLQPARVVHLDLTKGKRDVPDEFDGSMLVHVTQASSEGVAFNVLGSIADAVRASAKHKLEQYARNDRLTAPGAAVRVPLQNLESRSVDELLALGVLNGFPEVLDELRRRSDVHGPAVTCTELTYEVEGRLMLGSAEYRVKIKPGSALPALEVGDGEPRPREAGPFGWSPWMRSVYDAVCTAPCHHPRTAA